LHVFQSYRLQHRDKKDGSAAVTFQLFASVCSSNKTGVMSVING